MKAPFEGSAQAYDVVRQANVQVPMRDGLCLATDLYLPGHRGQPLPGPFPVVLERTPYDKAAAGNVMAGTYLAKRGYVCALQDVRGRYASPGEWYPFAKEGPDGFDTVEWLGGQPWSSGRVGTMGCSYCGTDQSALATLNPPHLAAMVVAMGASNYYHSSMRQNGALELRFMIYAFRMAETSREAEADPTIKAAIHAANARITDWLGRTPLKKGTSPLRLIPNYEQWVLDILGHGEYDDYWRQRGYAISQYHEEHADVPTLYLGGWYDSYARGTCENVMRLKRLKKSPQVLLMGPWTHGAWGSTQAGEFDFGPHSAANLNDLRLAWYDQHLKGLRSEVTEWPPVRIFVMGTGTGRPNTAGRLDHGGSWRDEPDYPLPDTRLTPYYFQPGGGLSTERPPATAAPSEYAFDPTDPVPTLGGGLSAGEPILNAGAFDQRGRPGLFGCRDSLPFNARPDVLTFQTDPLPRAMEVTGPIRVRLHAASSARDTDFTAKLIDVFPPSPDYPDGLAMNLSDSIIRARYRAGWERPQLLTPGEPCVLEFELYPTSNVFRAGHRIRVDISSSNFPRFDVNPNTGGPLGQERRTEVARQVLYHDAARPSHILLPVIAR